MHPRRDGESGHALVAKMATRTHGPLSMLLCILCAPHLAKATRS